MKSFFSTFFLITLIVFSVKHCFASEDVFRIEVEKASHTLTLYKNDEVLKTYDVIIGKPGTPTPALTTTFSQIDINPTWYPTVKSQNHLRKHPNLMIHYGIVKQPDGRLISPPSDKNPMGKARFNLNYQNPPIRIHGTSEPELFQTDRRNYSSGCVRVLEIKDLTETILGYSINWDKVQSVKLNKPIQVTIR